VGRCERKGAQCNLLAWNDKKIGVPVFQEEKKNLGPPGLIPGESEIRVIVSGKNYLSKNRGLLGCSSRKVNSKGLR